MEKEKVVVFPNEKIALLRTVPTIPEIYTEREWSVIKRSYRIHEQGKVSNICPSYSSLIDKGFNQVRLEIEESLKTHRDAEKIAYLNILIETLDIMEAFAERYRLAAIEVGNTTVAESFTQIPQNRPQNFVQALQFFRLIHFGL